MCGVHEDVVEFLKDLAGVCRGVEVQGGSVDEGVDGSSVFVPVGVLDAGEVQEFACVGAERLFDVTMEAWGETMMSQEMQEWSV